MMIKKYETQTKNKSLLLYQIIPLIYIPIAKIDRDYIAMMILAGVNPIDYCRTTFTEMKILTSVSLYIQDDMPLTTIWQEQASYAPATRGVQFYHHLTLYEKKPSYIGPKLLHYLPDNLKKISIERRFKKEPEEWLLKWSFHTMSKNI